MNRLVLTLILSMLSVGANAALIDRGGGMIYDDLLDITWLQDADYAQTSGYDADGLMSWYDANTWAADLSYGGHDDWRLPTSLQPDSNCTHGSGSLSWGSTCTGSEMGSLHYTTLGTAISQPLSNFGPFTNIQIDKYWTGTAHSGTGTPHAWFFDFANGEQLADQASGNHTAWAVADGDVAAALVPLPAAIWLFGSVLGLLALLHKKVS